MRHGFALCLLLASGAGRAVAQPVALPPLSLPERIVLADYIVVGKVVAEEDARVEAPYQVGSTAKVQHKVVSLKIDEAIFGGKGLTHLRVGFPVGVGGAGGVAGPGLRVGAGGMVADPRLEVGQEGCFFLARHHAADLLIVPPGCPPMEKKADDFTKQVTFVRRSVKLLADPIASLKSKDAEDRLIIAALLLNRYSTVRRTKPGLVKRVPIPEEDSKLILAALLEGDWDKSRLEPYSAMAAFQRLRLSDEDGYKLPNPKRGQEYHLTVEDNAQEWLKKHKDTFRVQKVIEDDQK
jgi:hypothetical protein